MPKNCVSQIRLAPYDEGVRCGPARFTLFMGELTVEFMEECKISKVRYSLGSIPFNQACRIHKRDGSATSFLVCNQWQALYVSYGTAVNGKAYPALHPIVYKREERIIDSPFSKSTSFCPDQDIPMYVKISCGTISVHICHGGLDAYRFDFPLSNLPVGSWYTPTDKHGSCLPLQLRRPLLAALTSTPAIDVKWDVQEK